MNRCRIALLVAPFVLGLGIAREASADVPHVDQVTPGALRGIALHDDDPWNMGYWEYLPADYVGAPEDRRWPLLVFLGGIGQSDDESVCPNGTDVCAEADCVWEGLCRATRRGPMRLMRNGTWDDVERNFIFVSPQHNIPTLSGEPWDPDELDAFFEYIVTNYPVDTRRMYMAGMSQGGRGVLEYTAAYPRRFTAIVPSPGGAVANDVTCHFEDTAVWSFHGEDDTDANLGTGVFDPCWMARRIHMANHPEAYSEFPRCVQRSSESFPSARMTMFYDEGHEVWIPANDPIGFGFATASWETAQDCFASDVDYRPYRPELDPDGIYTWFDGLDRPEVLAPDDLQTQQAAMGLTADVTDDDPVTLSWTQTAGPSATLTNADGATLLVSNLVADTNYTFEVRAVDADGQWDADEVTITTLEELVEGTTGGDGTTDGGESSDTGSVDPSGTSDASTTNASGTSGGAPTSTTGDDAVTTSGGGSTSGMTPVHESQGSWTWTAGADEDADQDSVTDTGCSCRTRAGPSDGAWLLFAAIAFVRRRRQTAGT